MKSMKIAAAAWLGLAMAACIGAAPEDAGDDAVDGADLTTTQAGAGALTLGGSTEAVSLEAGDACDSLTRPSNCDEGCGWERDKWGEDCVCACDYTTRGPRDVCRCSNGVWMYCDMCPR